MTLEKLNEKLEEHTTYPLNNGEKFVKLEKVLEDIEDIEDTHVVKPKVELTQTQADFIRSFCGDKEKALYFISRFGWGYFLEDGNGVSYTDETVEDEERLNKLMGIGSNANVKTLDELIWLLIDAIVNGYTVKEEVPLYRCVLDNKYSPHFDYLVARKDKSGLFLFMKQTNDPSEASLFTEEEAKEQLDWIIPHMEKVN